MWKGACVGVYQLLNWKMHGETLKLKKKKFSTKFIYLCKCYILCHIIIICEPF